MTWIQLAVVLLAIYLGARMGSIGVGFGGGVGVLVLTLALGMKPGTVPIEVILIIMSVIAAIASMQVAGGMDYLVSLAERLLRSNRVRIRLGRCILLILQAILSGARGIRSQVLLAMQSP